MPVYNNNVGAVIPAGASNYHVSWSFLLTKLQNVTMFAVYPVTIKTNSSGSPQDTITLSGGYKTAIWNNGISSYPGVDQPFFEFLTGCPFSGDVTGLYIDNPGTKDCPIKIASVVDP